ncbi:MAG: sugar phosphate nucleotidyltransferase [Leadbetterella sp.]|nr:sugar phosphate nucleotidyltransferase [Leadbetterella sp.]
MNKEKVFVLIMAGGAGTRFWPFSRNSYPKQFHDVLGTGQTLLQQTVERFRDICLPENVYILTSESYKEIVKEQLPFLIDDQILLEPMRKNTAPCIAYASYKIGQICQDALMIVAPADHIILKEKEFEATVLKAIQKASEKENLVTIGIKPNRPDTGYGYIEFNPEGEDSVKEVVSFKEKPALELAQKYVDAGNYAWNAGIFIWSFTSIKNAFENYSPGIAAIFCDLPYFSESEQNAVNNSFTLSENISIDYAILEKAQNVVVINSDLGWSDLGTWKSLFDISEKAQDNNVVEGTHVLKNVKNSIIKTPKGKLAVIQGLDGYIVAEYKNAFMICPLEEEQSVKSFVDNAKNLGIEYV